VGTNSLPTNPVQPSSKRRIS